MSNRFITALKSRKWRWLYITLAVFLILAVVVGTYAYQKRDAMLMGAINKAKTKLLEKYDMELKIQYYAFQGMNAVQFKNIQLLPKNRAPLAQINDLTVSVKLWPLLFGDVKLGQVVLDHGAVSLVKKDTISNYDFLFKKQKKDTVENDNPKQNLAALADRLLKNVFFKIPNDLDLKDLELSYQDDSTSQRIVIPSAVIDGGDMESKFLLNSHEAAWNLTGTIDPDNQECDLRLFSDKKGVDLPLLRRKFGLAVSFDEISFRLDKAHRRNKELLELHGQWGFKNLKVNHWRISSKDVIFPEATMQGALNIGASSIEVSKESTVQAKDFIFSPYMKYVHKPKKEIFLAIHTEKIEAQHFFDAIPAGLFPSLEDIQVEGHIQYDLNFALELKKPDNLLFSSKIDDRDLNVVKWGEANIAMLNTPFTYTAYEDGKPMREIVVGPQNPNFTPLDQISRYMQISLINTEDPFFFKHKGFEEKAFKLSIVTNIKEKGFKRGASTISMQLVKNVFLNRNKTVVRKLEEILLVWLMERSQQVSKKRMYEVYLNVIEWGNNVYGITEAARYYFGKTPAQLGLGESIFLSSIVPRPKKGLNFFDWTGHLRGNMLRYFNTYGYIMTKTGQIGVDSTRSNYGFYDVVLLPHLRSARPAVVDQVDTVDMGDESLLFENLESTSPADNLEGISLPKSLESKSLPEKQTEETTEKEKPKRSLFDKILGRKKDGKEKKDDEKN
ncbi:transglycosylase domain-containing protein [Sphingobacterium sp. N143]|uniref:biosynthetic peptidoglycan transglycosylase n=1 Tax=Sphingobacterium sp. N143 TaxID=2746727 RepID=UPI002577DF68|nr:biosynthetic peptidoglycan transglycosylase [Sphingobacterium sp. N143]MDM1293751.1 transglycosylase domain-containing protein [Sphingobacterium sp. N143]